MQSIPSNVKQIPNLDDPNYVKFFEKTKNSNLFAEFYKQMKNYLDSNKFNDDSNLNIKQMVNIILNQRDYYRKSYHQTFKDLEQKSEELKFSINENVKLCKKADENEKLIESFKQHAGQHDQQYSDYQANIDKLNAVLNAKSDEYNKLEYDLLQQISELKVEYRKLNKEKIAEKEQMEFENNQIKQDLQLTSERTEKLDLALKGANQKIADFKKRSSAMDELLKNVQKCAVEKYHEINSEMQKNIRSLTDSLEEISKDRDYWKNQAQLFKDCYDKAQKYKTDAEKLSSELVMVKHKLEMERNIREEMKVLLNIPEEFMDFEVLSNYEVAEEEFQNDSEVNEIDIQNEGKQQRKRVHVHYESDEEPVDKQMRTDATTNTDNNVENPTFLMPVLFSENSNQASIEPLPIEVLLSQFCNQP